MNQLRTWIGAVLLLAAGLAGGYVAGRKARVVRPSAKDASGRS